MFEVLCLARAAVEIKTQQQCFLLSVGEISFSPSFELLNDHYFTAIFPGHLAVGACLSEHTQ